MRSILPVNKLLAVSCIIFFTFLTSCNRYQNQTESVGIVTRFIQIIDRSGTTHRLIIKDEKENSADIFIVHRGEKIKWLLGNNQSVIKITNIYKKPGSKGDNIFNVSDTPHSIAGSLNWEGTIDRHADYKAEEEYNIDWIDKDGNPHTFDPLIQVRPRQR